jgi:hypothetical protein
MSPHSVAVWADGLKACLKFEYSLKEGEHCKCTAIQRLYVLYLSLQYLRGYLYHIKLALRRENKYRTAHRKNIPASLLGERNTSTVLLFEN